MNQYSKREINTVKKYRNAFTAYASCMCMCWEISMSDKTVLRRCKRHTFDLF